MRSPSACTQAVSSAHSRSSHSRVATRLTTLSLIKVVLRRRPNRVLQKNGKQLLWISAWCNAVWVSESVLKVFPGGSRTRKWWSLAWGWCFPVRKPRVKISTRTGCCGKFSSMAADPTSTASQPVGVRGREQEKGGSCSWAGWDGVLCVCVCACECVSAKQAALMRHRRIAA